MPLTTDEKRYLLDLCRVFNIPPYFTEPNEEHALVILSSLYSYLSLQDRDDKRRYRDQVLRETARVWTQHSPFFGRVQGTVALLIAIPHYYASSDKSNAELIDSFKNILIGTFVLEILGVGSLFSAASKSLGRGIEDRIKTGSIRKGLEAARRRLIVGAGSGIVEALAGRLGFAAGPYALFGVVVLVGAYAGMMARLEDIRAEMRIRMHNGAATQAEYDQLQDQSFFAILQEALRPYWQ